MIAILVVPSYAAAALPRLIAGYSTAEMLSVYTSEVGGGFGDVVRKMLLTDPALLGDYLSQSLDKFLESRARIICHPASTDAASRLADSGYSLAITCPREWDTRRVEKYLQELGFPDDLAASVASDAIATYSDAPRALKEWTDLEDLFPLISNESGDYMRMFKIQEEIITDILTRFDEEHGTNIFDRPVRSEADEGPLDDEERGKEKNGANFMEDESPSGLYDDDSLAEETVK